MTPGSHATIRDVYRQFNPREPLEAGDPRYVDLNAVRGVPQLVSRLTLPLEDTRDYAAVLFAGLLGDGKTTLLKKLRQELHDEGRLVAFADAEERLNLGDVESEDVVLLILAAVEAMLLERRGQGVQEEGLHRLWQDFYEILGQELDVDKINVALGPIGKLTFKNRDTPAVRTDFRKQLQAAQGPTFIDLANDFLDEARRVLGDGAKDWVVILDGLDKISPRREGGVSQDERLFVDQRSDLAKLRCHVIYTLPLALAVSQGTSLGAYYGQRPVIAPMVPIFERDGQAHPEGRERLRRVLELRLNEAGTSLDAAFDSPGTVELLLEATGGYLRDLMSLVRGICQMAGKNAELPLTARNARQEIRSVAASLRQAASPHWDALEQIHRTRRLTDLDSEIQQKLLTNRLVCLYYDDEDYRYDVCQAVRDKLGSDAG